MGQGLARRVNKYTFILAWREFVHELKYLMLVVAIVYIFMCLTAQT